MLEKYSSRNSDLAYQLVEESMVVLNPSNDKIYTLNPVASLIFEASNGKNKIKDIIAQVCKEFDVGEELAQNDTVSFIKYAVENNLLSVVDSPHKKS